MVKFHVISLSKCSSFYASFPHSLPSFEVKIMMTSNKNKSLSKKTIDKNTDQFYENRQKTHYFSEFA